MADGSREQPNIPYSPAPSVAPVTDTPGGYLTAQANPGAFGAMGEAFRNLGQTVENVAGKAFSTAEQNQKMALETSANENSTDFAVNKVSPAEAQFYQLEGQNAANAFPNFKKDLSDDLETRANAIQSPYERMLFLRDSRSFFERTIHYATIHAQTEAKKAVDTAALGNIKAIQDQAALHSDDTEGLPDYFLHISDKVTEWSHGKGVFDENSIAENVSKAVGDTIDDVIKRQMANNDGTLEGQVAALNKAEQTLRTFETQEIPQYPGHPLIDKDHLSSLDQLISSKRWSVNSRQETEGNRIAAHLRTSLNTKLKNMYATIDSGNTFAGPFPTPDEIDAAYPNDPDVAQSRKEDVELYEKANQFSYQIADSNPQQIQARLQQLEPDYSKPEQAKQLHLFEKLRSVAKARDTALHDDAIGYGLTHNDRLNTMFTAWKSGNKAISWDDYAREAKAWQHQVGIPESEQSLLPKSEAEGAATSVMNNPARAKDVFNQLEKKYGGSDDWSTIQRDLTLKGGLSPQYQAIMNIDNQNGQLLARLLTEAKQNKKAVSDIMTQDDKTNLPKSIKADPTMGEFVYSIVNQPGGSIGDEANVLQSAQSIAFARMNYLHEDRDTAVTNAVKALTGGYGFHPNGGARIPADQMDKVLNYTGHFMDTLTSDKLSHAGGGFDRAWAFTGKHEGGLNEKDANGYPVNFGFNQKYNKDIDVHSLTPETAKERAHNKYWKQSGAEDLPTDMQTVYFDTYFINEAKAKQFLEQSHGNPNAFMSLRENWMKGLLGAGDGNPADGETASKYQHWEKAWNNRNRDLRNEIANSNNNPALSDKQYLTDLRNNPTWVNNSSETGLLLKDSHGRFVKNNEGKIIQILFNQMNIPAQAAKPAFEMVGDAHAVGY
jgi:hypothetical protein